MSAEIAEAPHGYGAETGSLTLDAFPHGVATASDGEHSVGAQLLQGVADRCLADVGQGIGDLCGVVQAIVGLRRQLHDEGHDAGAQTIAYHLAGRMEGVPSGTTIWRILKREGLIVSQPQKRPRSSLIRFEADLPNETSQHGGGRIRTCEG